jgi:hypothetical protein
MKIQNAILRGVVVALTVAVAASVLLGQTTTTVPNNTIQPVAGPFANNTATAASPVPIGAVSAVAGTTTVVSTPGNVSRMTVDNLGALFTRPGGSGAWSAFQSALSTTLTQLLAAPAGGMQIWITDIEVQSTTTTASTFQLKYGTGSNCGTGTTVASPLYVSPANTANPTVVSRNMAFSIPAANAICGVCGSATNTCFAHVSGFVGQ